jgi:aminoglycoside phosphotransferase (APT) family kinase protein
MSDGSEEYFERLVDVDALESYLEEALGPAETFDVSRHQEGHSNETLFVTWGDQELVIRRPPPGETADTAHDVLREHRVLSALQDTEVRVPTTVLASDDHDVMGSDFYVMEREEGVVIRGEEPEQFAEPEYRRAVGEEMIDTLAEVHEVDYEAAGLGEFGYPDGFSQRQVDRWEQQYEWAFEVTEEDREVPVVHEVTEWLQENVPEEYPHTLVHGDYKLDNVMFGSEAPPEIISVFDWEMSTLGDPFTDLGWFLSYWPDEKDPSADVGTAGEASFLLNEGYPTRVELVERYEDITGYEFENDRFYRALAVYKLGALGEMFYRRYLEGNSDDDMYPIMEERVPALGRRAKRIIDGDEPL